MIETQITGSESLRAALEQLPRQVGAASAAALGRLGPQLLQTLKYRPRPEQWPQASFASWQQSLRMELNLDDSAISGRISGNLQNSNAQEEAPQAGWRGALGRMGQSLRSSLARWQPNSAQGADPGTLANTLMTGVLQEQAAHVYSELHLAVGRGIQGAGL